MNAKGALALAFFHLKEDRLLDSVTRVIDACGWQVLWQQKIEAGARHAFLIFDAAPNTRDPYHKLAKKLGKRLKATLLTEEARIWDAMQKLAPADIEQLKNNRTEAYRAMHPEDDDVKVMSTLPGNSVRSRIELVEIAGKKYVRKLFKLQYARFLTREIEARKYLAHPAISPLVAYKYNYLIIPYYEPRFDWRDDGLRLYPLAWARDVMRVMDFISRQGYAMIDWHPGAVVVDKKEGVKLVDFEYAVPAQRQGTPLDESIDYKGLPQQSSIEHPGRTNCSYGHMWYPVLGVSLSALMEAPDYALHLKRGIFMLTVRLPKYLLRSIENMVKCLRWLVRPPYHRDGDIIVI